MDIEEIFDPIQSERTCKKWLIIQPAVVLKETYVVSNGLQRYAFYKCHLFDTLQLL